jgi:hypothetical protein
VPNRILRDSITESESLSRLTSEEERFFCRLLTKADDFGRFDARPPIVRASCFKLMLDSITAAQVEAWLRRLADPDIDVVRLYEVAGRSYGVFTHWNRYQRPPRAQESKYPEPPQNTMLSDDNICQTMTTSDNICQTCLSDAPVVVDVVVVEDVVGIENGNVIENGNEDGNAAVVVPLPPGPPKDEKTTTTAGGPSYFLEELTTAYEANIGTVTPVLAELMFEFDGRLHPPPRYAEQAVLEAVVANVRKWSYIAAILERWCAQGGRTPAPVRRGKKPASSGDPNRYIAEYVRRRGHLPESRDSPEVPDTN